MPPPVLLIGAGRRRGRVLFHDARLERRAVAERQFCDSDLTSSVAKLMVSARRVAEHTFCDTRPRGSRRSLARGSDRPDRRHWPRGGRGSLERHPRHEHFLGQFAPKGGLRSPAPRSVPPCASEVPARGARLPRSEAVSGPSRTHTNREESGPSLGRRPDATGDPWT